MGKTNQRAVVKTKKNKAPVTAMVSKSSKRAPLPRTLRMATGPLSTKSAAKTHADVKAWLKQLSSMFDRSMRPVSMPLFKDLYPCPTTIVGNVGSANILMAASNTNVVFQFWPNGVTLPGNSAQQIGANGIFSGAVNGRLGPNLDSVTNRSTAGGFFQTTAVLAENASVSSVLTALTPLLYDPLVNPFPSGQAASSAPTGMQFRTAGFGVRFSFVGKLTDTEGYVEWYAPYELPNAAPVTLIRGLRKDPTYRRAYFSDHRTFDFFWEPTCDDIEFSQDNGDLATVTSAISRHFAIIGGLAPGDKIEVEYVHFQDWTGHRGLATAVPVYVAQNPAALTNTILATHGSVNDNQNDNSNEGHGPIDKWEVYSHVAGIADKAVDLFSKFAKHPGSAKLARLLGRAAGSVF